MLYENRCFMKMHYENRCVIKTLYDNHGFARIH